MIYETLGWTGTENCWNCKGHTLLSHCLLSRGILIIFETMHPFTNISGQFYNLKFPFHFWIRKVGENGNAKMDKIHAICYPRWIVIHEARHTFPEGR